MPSIKNKLQNLLRGITIFMMLAIALGSSGTTVAQAASNTWTATGSLVEESALQRAE